ncbi:glycosyltransferase family 2 protein [Haliea sp. E17]|uniref:glycosyltransferase family 2 protein n=1 Tax=Haliea sp. E17 TaxID=3401576 RepID=UPI003AAF5B19
MARLSIIIVTLNAASALEKTLDSVFSQTFDDYELVIIDGQSTDRTVDIIRNCEERLGYWVSEPDDGIYAAMNKGLQAASGEYVQFLNAGDCFVDSAVLEQVFCTDDRPDLFYGDIYRVGVDGSLKVVSAEDFTEKNLLRHGTGVICHQAMFVRRAVTPVYDTRYRFKGELNWYFDLVQAPGFRYVKCEHAIVNYELGGWGYQNFLRNRLDWIRVAIDRFGWPSVWKSGLLGYLWINSFFRYPVLKKVDHVLKLPGKLIRKCRRLFSA